MASNFEFLANFWPGLALLGAQAEQCLYSDPGASMVHLGTLAESASAEICVLENMDLPPYAAHTDRIRALKRGGLLPLQIEDLLLSLHKARGDALHMGLASRKKAEGLLEPAFHLCCWLMQVYGDQNFSAPAFVIPEETICGDAVAGEEKIAAPLSGPAEKSHLQAHMSKEDRIRRSHAVAASLATSGIRIPVRMDVAALPVINLALQQNRTPMIQTITIENATDTPICDVELQISSAPAFTLPFTQHIDHLPAGKPVTITRPQVLLSGEFFSSMTEKMTGVLHIRLKSQGKTLVYDNVELTILAFDQWHGSALYPELLTSFVTPNHPDVTRILSRATDFLGNWTGDTSLDGYQSQDPNRVLNQAAAIFAAMKEQNIAYAVAPASFEETGQRIRLCDKILQQKLGNCLDLTLMYAACLEAAGLHPLLIATTGHIFTGLWLENKMFSESVQDDFSLITKRLAPGIQEIAVVETTAVTTSADCSFDEARALGEQSLTKGDPDYIIDVLRARLSQISPLPLQVNPSNTPAVFPPAEQSAAPTRLQNAIQVDSSATEEVIPKKAQWERKLLDLGMRNTLINLRMTKTQLPILTGSLETLENALASGSDFTILPKPTDLQLEQFSFDALTEPGKHELIRAEFENKRLRSVLSEAELGKTIKDLYRSAKTALEENGANTLYLALGMLRWYETTRSAKARYAPIVLLPIEMVRKSASQGYVIRLRDEEPQMNITLLEKLKQDFGILISGLDPLPCDDHGIDIRKVLTIVRKAVMEQPRWDVLEAASIGIFSFSQFVMWNDIRNRTEDLLRNKVVRSLMEGKLCWNAKPLQMGQTVTEDHVLLPMAADASQLFAIQAAGKGESFVLHGPPGTGKSQTITSLIANALANGKRVLFVAEKMAALEVVQRRLDKIGLGPFCLELHSNKSKKRDVLEQLRCAMEVAKAQSAGEYEAQALQLSATRAELDSYARQLHRMLPCGHDVHALINEFEQYRQGPELTAFDRDFVRSMTPQSLQQQQLAVERLIAAAREIGHPAGHPLGLVGCTQYSQSLRGNLRPTVEAYSLQLSAIRAHVTQMAEALGLDLPSGFGDIQQFLRIANAMACWYDVPAAWAQVRDPKVYFGELTALCTHAASAREKRQTLLQSFEPGILDLDGAALLEAYTQALEKWFLPKALGIQSLTRALRAHAKSPVRKESVSAHITLLRDYQQDQKITSDLLSKYGQDLGQLYSQEATDWDSVRHLAGRAQESAEVLLSIFGNLDNLHRHGGSNTLRNAIFGLIEGFSAFEASKNTFDDLLQIRQTSGENWLSGQIDLCREVLNHSQQLKEWITYTANAAEVRSLGLGNVVDHYEQGADHNSIFIAYQKTMLQGLIFDALEESDTLNQFSGPVFNKQIQQYQRMDQQWAILSQQEVFCRLASKVPDFTREAAHSSELGILQRFIKGGGRGTSIRKLFDQIPNLLPRLCPCMLMSPISAAQYLDPKGAPFDIVVFDEASQLPTCKAVGVLARGENAVIVGDPKQMPPTSFFATNTVDEDNLEAEDLESILDDCLALNMPQSHLLWHYRSRHESLIAFSNSRFYENKLFTFPSVNDRQSKVTLVHIQGQFDRGKTRTNRVEAEAVVAEIQRRAKDPNLSKQSLGVVTFNISQQHLIDDLLTEACARDPELDKWVYREEEPLFIKNLENVQGDERDVILFSIGFGPDAQGKVHMNFGPLNRDGGWRRLNVAVTRSRQEMMVFSTLLPEQLDLNRTQAEGVCALRSFLEYAQGRSLALEAASVTKQADSTDGIAQAICQTLKDAGYDTDLSVGRSAYRIDIGVVDPADPERYLLGILLDGDAYGAAKTTRDRELAQIGVLQGLGWKILRVWTMDWWDNSEKEQGRILRAVQEAQIQTPPPPSEPESDTPAPANTPTAMPAEPQSAPKQAPFFVPANLPTKAMTAEDFVDSKNKRVLRKKIEDILEAEAPMSQAVLTKRLVQSCGITRAGNRIQTHLQGVLDTMELPRTIQDGMAFYWAKEQNPELYFGLRVNGEGDHRRDIKDIPRQEIANAIYMVLYEQIGMSREDLLRETAAKLGYRMGSQVLSAMEAGLACAQEQTGITTGPNGTFILSGSGTARAEGILQAF